MLETNNPVLKAEISFWFFRKLKHTVLYWYRLCKITQNIKGLWSKLLSLSCIFLVKSLLQKIPVLAVKAVIKILFVKEFAFTLAANLVLTEHFNCHSVFWLKPLLSVLVFLIVPHPKN